MRTLWKLLGEYFFVVGLSLTVAGAILIFTNPLGIVISGVVLFLIGWAIRLGVGMDEEAESGIPIYLLNKIKKLLNKHQKNKK